MSILVFNAGSSSLKFGLFDRRACQPLVSGGIDWAGGDRQRAKLAIDGPQGPLVRGLVDVPADRRAATCAIEALAALPAADGRPLPAIVAVGHRVVYGAAEFADCTAIDDGVKRAIQRLFALAPLHNPPAYAAIEAAEAALPTAAQVAVFDTAFYAGLPPRAHVYPLPYQWYAEWGIRRFGFHGISHKYCAGRAAEMLGRRLDELRIVSCHLGGGCSAAAIRDGRPIATTMGFTPLEGLMMGTRSGSIDPGILLHVQRQHRLTPAEMDDALNNRSGLLGVSGVSPDFAVIEAAAAQGDPRAQLAVEMFADRVRAAIGALAVGLGGVDVLLFTDRVGEGSPGLRAAACEGLQCLGLQLDPRRNAACRPDADLASDDSPGRILVVRTREDLMIARETQRLLFGGRVEGDAAGGGITP